MSQEDLEWIRKNHIKLQEKYPGTFIAVHNEEILGFSRYYGDVRKIAKSKSKDFAIGYIEDGDLHVF